MVIFANASWSNSEDISSVHVLGRIFNLFVLNSTRRELLRFPKGCVLSGKTSSDATFKTITGWIAERVADHPHYRTLAQDRYYSPLRVPDLTNGMVRLAEGLKCISYACLSHCWGDSGKLLRTTSFNFERFVNEGISWSELTNAFQRRYRYIPTLRNRISLD